MCEVRIEPESHEPPTARTVLEKPNASSTKPRPNRIKVNVLCASVILASFLVVSTIGGISLGLRLRQEKINSKPAISQQLIDDATDNQGPTKNEIFLNNLPAVVEKKIITKEQWKAAPPNKKILPLRKPIRYVIISHTAGQFCETFDVCSVKVRWIQKYHLADAATADIKYNFLIGGDGNIYEGRGWNLQNTLRSDSINVGLIGNFVFDRMTENVLEAVKYLLAIGEQDGYLASDYKLVCHNQTANTESPGPNVYRKIKTFPHFIPDLVR